MDRGRDAGWKVGFTGGCLSAVLASWNDQLEEDRDFLSPAWHQTAFALPDIWRERRVIGIIGLGI